MFEILEDFVKNECSPGNIDWDYDDEHRTARAKMDELLNWWNNRYLKAEELEQPIRDALDKLPLHFDFIPCETKETATESQKLQQRVLYQELWALEEELEKELDEKLIEILKIRKYFWT